MARTRSADVRARCNHPVVDSDGHLVEFGPILFDYLKRVAGPALLERYLRTGSGAGLAAWYRLSPEERLRQRFTRPPWWPFPARNTLDRATATLPRLLKERMPELGLDFAVLYPTLGLFALSIEDEEMRGVACRAFNLMHAELLRDCADRMTAVAVIPMHTPSEAIAELEYAVGNLGLKAIMMAGHVRRPVPAVAEKFPEASRHAYWLDTFTIDSAYDYDPVWAKCVELRVMPTFHSAGMGWGSRSSPTNYVFNHLGNFAAAGEATCRALVMGGVAKRFPSLKFAFLEGGVGWGCNLYSDLIGHWEKRNRKHLENYNPAGLDRKRFAELVERYGGEPFRAHAGDVGGGFLASLPEDPTMLDEFRSSGIERVEDLRDIFRSSFYFGCEADDPINAWAFNSRVNPLGLRMNPLLGSDIGHWDVTDMTEIVGEAWELVEHGLISEADFRDFVFGNAVHFWAALNPDFFTGTVIESDATRERHAG